MAGPASDARSSEAEIRRQLVESGAIDAVVAVGPNMFYTVALPCTLWFLDRAKASTKQSGKVLFIDARHIYRQVDRAHRDWTAAQAGFLANVVRLHRGEALDFTLGGDGAAAKIREVFGKKPAFKDVAGLCRLSSIDEIAAHGWSLNPGRFVGVASEQAIGEEEFEQKLATLVEEFESLSRDARALEQTISANVASVLEA